MDMVADNTWPIKRQLTVNRKLSMTQDAEAIINHYAAYTEPSGHSSPLQHILLTQFREDSRRRTTIIYT